MRLDADVVPEGEAVAVEGEELQWALSLLQESPQSLATERSRANSTEGLQAHGARPRQCRPSEAQPRPDNDIEVNVALLLRTNDLKK